MVMLMLQSFLIVSRKMVTNQEAGIQALLFVEPMTAHEEKCSVHKDHTKCNCYQLENARTRLDALEKAGWKRVKEKKV